MRIYKSAGFTLIELMIVVAIIGTILAFALPAYDKQMLKSRRADAKTALLALAQLQESFNMNNANQYADTLLGTGGLNCEHKGICEAAGTVATTPEGFYTLTVTDLAGKTGTGADFVSGFILTATIAAGKAQDQKWERERCASLSINSRGQKTAADSSSGTANSADCW